MEICGTENIIHRDIKPDNIFVNVTGDYKLGDFGIARSMDRTISNMSQKGTYLCMAPEVYWGKPYGSTVDIYSLAMVLYRFLNNNRTPFIPQGMIRYDDKKKALERRMSGEAVPEPIYGSEVLKSVILKALSYHPENRYSSASEFANALNTCLADIQKMEILNETRIDIFHAKEILQNDIKEKQKENQKENQMEETIIVKEKKEKRGIPKGWIALLILLGCVGFYLYFSLGRRGIASRKPQNELESELAETSTQNSDTENVIKSTVFTSLADYIKKNGEKNQYEGYVIEKEGIIAKFYSKGNIYVDSDCIELWYTEENSLDTFESVDMQLRIFEKENYELQYYFYKDSDINNYSGFCTLLNPKTYHDQSIHYDFFEMYNHGIYKDFNTWSEYSEFMQGTIYVEVGKASLEAIGSDMLRKAMPFWEDFLKDSGFSLQDIGFLNY